MRLNISIDARAAQAAFRKAPHVFQKQLRIASKQGLTLIQRHARRNHRFTTRSGMAERSISVKRDRDFINGGKVFLDTGAAIYGPRLHKGWGTWKKDEFLFKAARKKTNEVVGIIEKGIGKAIILAGLS